MLTWVNNKWIWAEGKIEQLRNKNRLIHFLCAVLPPFFLVALVEKAIHESEWGTIINIVLYGILGLSCLSIVTTLLFFEIRAAKSKKVQISYTGWAFAIVLLFFWGCGLWKSKHLGKNDSSANITNSTESTNQTVGKTPDLSKPKGIILDASQMAKLLNDVRPNKVEVAAKECFYKQDYTNAILLFRHTMDVEDGDLGWRADYPYYAGSILLSGDRGNGEKEFQNMLRDVQRQLAPYNSWDTRQQLLRNIQDVEDLTTGKDDEIVHAAIAQIQVFQKINHK